MKKYYHFGKVFEYINEKFLIEGSVLHTEKWQSTKIKDNPAAKMVEILHHSFLVDMKNMSLSKMSRQVRPNLPWADKHFQERVCGEPLNPGVEWANWPWGNSADGHREPDGTFNHNYMERYWPKYAGMTEGGNIDFDLVGFSTNKGIRHEYGDLNDLVLLLAKEPDTRQAYMPIWFPEDTGVTHSGRKPCSIGYHFIMRDGHLDITYQIRSCDYAKHFRDDIYLTIRLLHWVLEKLKKIAPEKWDKVVPGSFIMHTTSLHIFINDYIKLFGRTPNA